MRVDGFVVVVRYTECEGVVMKDSRLGACSTFAFCHGSESFDSLQVINMKKQKIKEFFVTLLGFL